MQKKFSLTLLTVVLSGSLVACGGGGSSSSSNGGNVSSSSGELSQANSGTTPTTANSDNNGSGADSNQSDNNPTKISLYEFDTSIDYDISTNTTKLSNITKTNLIYTNTYAEVEENLFGTKSASNLNTTRYVVGENFLREMTPETQYSSNKNIKFTQLTNKDYQVSYDVIGKDDSQYSITKTLKPIDISGEIYLDNFTINNIKLEFLGNFRYLDKFPKALTLPTGSICYTDVSSQQTKVVYNFSSNNSIDNLNSLDEFIAELDADEKNSIRHFNVGLNNEFPMIEFKDSRSNELTYAIFYQGKVYAYLQQKPKSWTANTNQPLYCLSLNDVASNYLTEEIKKAIQ